MGGGFGGSGKLQETGLLGPCYFLKPTEPAPRAFPRQFHQCREAFVHNMARGDGSAGQEFTSHPRAPISSGAPTFPRSRSGIGPQAAGRAARRQWRPPGLAWLCRCATARRWVRRPRSTNVGVAIQRCSRPITPARTWRSGLADCAAEALSRNCSRTWRGGEVPLELLKESLETATKANGSSKAPPRRGSPSPPTRFRLTPGSCNPFPGCNRWSCGRTPRRDRARIPIPTCPTPSCGSR